jgi:hypothetical protein
MATDRLRDEWGFECAWSTAEAVLDLRRAVTGIVSVAKHRIELPWRLRFPTQHPGDVLLGEHHARPPAVDTPGELDTLIPLSHPTYSRVTASAQPLPALTLSTHAYLLRAATTGVLDAFGLPEADRRVLGGAGAGSFGHRLYVNDDVRVAIASGGRRRRVLDASYSREVKRLAAWVTDTLARATELRSQSDARLDATLSALRDELAWFWAIASVGAALDGEPFAQLDGLVTLLPHGASLAAIDVLAGAAAVGAARHAAPRAQAERTAIALGQALAAAVGERARRLVALGSLKDPNDSEHLTWDELLSPSGDLAAIVKQRRAEQRRLSKLAPPQTISAIGPDSAINIDPVPAKTKETVAL